MTGQSTDAVAERCPVCRALILAAWTDGLWVLVDLQPVVPSGEVAAIRAGLLTFLLRHGRLQFRANEQIVAERRYAPLLVEHQCMRLIPPGHCDMTAAPIITESTTEGIPF